MKLILLLFPSVEALIRFRLVADPTILKVNLNARILFCLCSDHQLELAEYVYEARVIEPQPSLN